MANWHEMNGCQLPLMQGDIRVCEIVILITSLLFGEEENTLTGESHCIQILGNLIQ